ncbi:BTAD domain-containing putative transcriptional regulator [Streptomyces sp. KLOTTS4A1]|uniref:AfsR/SARP family transcriptional regulator n=1 Tax=Streptomyces sp. KLOTTS4A1 TaxID=3390996 RepID=UPI0039F4D5FD
MAVEFSVLGDVRVLLDGRAADLGHARRQCVLLALLVDAGHVVPVDRLIHRVWGTAEPAGARQALHSYLSRLRRALSPAGERATIERRPGGYLLRLGPEGETSVDLHRFRRLVERARSRPGGEWEASVRLLDEALLLWHGDAFGALDSPWLNEVRVALHQERRRAELDRNDLMLRLGRQAAILPGLLALVERDPLDERATAQLMWALHREGRSAEALERYEAVRRRLSREMGTDPGPSLRAVHLDILHADLAPGPDLVPGPDLAPEPDPAPGPDPAPDGAPGALRPPGARDLPRPRTGDTRRRLAATVTPRQLPSPPAYLTGRDKPLAALDEALGRQTESPRLAVVCGLGGVGKTSLALRWSHDNAAAFPDGQLHVDLRGFDPDRKPLDPHRAVRGFLAALGVGPDATPAEPEAQLGLYRSLVAGRRLLIVLDDAHSPEQVRPLLPGTPSCAVVVTSRDRLEGLRATEGARPVELGPLTDEEAHRLLAARLGAQWVAADPDAVARIVRGCGRLPLALAVAAARAGGCSAPSRRLLAAELGGARSRLDVLDTGDARTSLRTVLDTTCRSLHPSAVRLLCLLALAPGRGTTLSAAVTVSGHSPPATSGLLRSLESVHLVRRGADGRFVLPDLVRAYAAERAVTEPYAGDGRPNPDRFTEGSGSSVALSPPCRSVSAA